MLLCGVAMFLCGIILPLLLYTAGMNEVTDALEDNVGLLMGALVGGFVGIFVGLFALNKCVGVAGVYLKALRIAYPKLPHMAYRRDDSYYGIRGEYDPKAYRTGRRDKALLASLESAGVDEARARGLLNYAISGREQGRKMLAYALVGCALMLSLRAYLVTQAVGLWTAAPMR